MSFDNIPKPLISYKEFIDTHLYHLELDLTSKKILFEELVNFIYNNQVIRKIKQHLLDIKILEYNESYNTITLLSKFFRKLFNIGIRPKIKATSHYYINKYIGKDILAFLLVIQNAHDLSLDYIEFISSVDKNVREYIINMLTKAHISGSLIGYHTIKDLLDPTQYTNIKGSV